MTAKYGLFPILLLVLEMADNFILVWKKQDDRIEEFFEEGEKYEGLGDELLDQRRMGSFP